MIVCGKNCVICDKPRSVLLSTYKMPLYLRIDAYRSSYTKECSQNEYWPMLLYFRTQWFSSLLSGKPLSIDCKVYIQIQSSCPFIPACMCVIRHYLTMNKLDLWSQRSWWVFNSNNIILSMVISTLVNVCRGHLRFKFEQSWVPHYSI